MAKVYHRTYQEYREGWDRIRSAIRGQDRIHQEGQLHLPKPEGMSIGAYQAYVKRASFYGVAERTLRGMVGATTRTPPILTLPPRLEPMRDAAT